MHRLRPVRHALRRGRHRDRRRQGQGRQRRALRRRRLLPGRLPRGRAHRRAARGPGVRRRRRRREDGRQARRRRSHDTEVLHLRAQRDGQPAAAGAHRGQRAPGCASSACPSSSTVDEHRAGRIDSATVDPTRDGRTSRTRMPVRDELRQNKEDHGTHGNTRQPARLGEHHARAHPRRRRGHRLRPHAGAGRAALPVLRGRHPLLDLLAGPLPHHRQGAARRVRHRRRRHGHARLSAAEHDGHRRLHLPRRRGHEDPGAGQARRHLRDQGLEQARAAGPRRGRRARAQGHAAQARCRHHLGRVQPRPSRGVAAGRRLRPGAARRGLAQARRHARRRAAREQPLPPRAA